MCSAGCFEQHFHLRALVDGAGGVALHDGDAGAARLEGELESLGDVQGFDEGEPGEVGQAGGDAGAPLAGTNGTLN